ncbi:A-family ABC transporter [Chloropicon primus]|uniref:A-family ABC transporter n=1 Tax=Chloropicon primus TaxID=1764295 RepID=A0A5B8MF25_9CHLO|nr:A-family ABC transporter [Chloropicon primus]UPQ98295.1 A-family ABC transporter [Chloropicon primus]|eukprot:QDZ19086.1 A-family ABC transporter [Chloropicon primus]
MRWFGVLELLLPVLIMLCCYIPSLVVDLKDGHQVVPEAVYSPREIMDIRWTQSEGSYCGHLASIPEGARRGFRVPTKIAYVSHDSPLSEEVIHQAAGYLLCKTTTGADFPLKNLTSVSKHFPGAFLAILGLSDLGARADFSFLDVVWACHNLNALEEKLSGAGAQLTSEELDGSVEEWYGNSDDLDEILDRLALTWSSSEDVLPLPKLACAEECLNDAECLRSHLDGILVKHENVGEALESARSNPGTVMAVVDLPPERESYEEYPYTIYVDAAKVPDLNKKYVNWAVDAVGAIDKWKNYFAAANIQNAVDNAVTKIFSGTLAWDLVPYYSPYPAPAHANPFKGWISGLVNPNIIVFSFVPAVALQMQFLMYDRHLKLRKYTALVEMNKTLYSALLCAIAVLPYLFLAGIVSLVLSYVYPLASTSLVFFVFVVWFVALCLFNALIATFCSSSVLASIAAVVAYLVFWIPGLLTCNIMRNGSPWWLVVSVFPPSSLYALSVALSHFEQLETGLRWENINASVMDDGQSEYLSCGTLLLVVALSTGLWGLGLLIDDHGGIFAISARLRQNFFGGLDAAALTYRSPDSVVDVEGGAYEVASARRVAALELQNISKSYGKHRAVRNFSMKVFQDNLTILLGHNGAGKTTLMSILGGALSPTSGELRIMGEDCAVRKRTLRKSLGICHQLDFLWPTLTVMEHVILVRRLKGLRRKSESRVTSLMLEALNMEPCFSTPTSRLSGGQKRKLSLILSFVGNPQIILLDEPTAGMDSASRRTVWQFLKNRADSNSIFMTTHLMDEADALGDRVAIMSKGELLCYGSGAFLKKQYAAGYRLLLSGKSTEEDAVLGEKIEEYFPGESIPHLVSGKSMILYLPERCKNQISSFLDTIRKRSIAHRMSVSRATLNDVFLKTLQEAPKTKRKKSAQRSLGDKAQSPTRTTLRVLLWKHRVNYSRNLQLIITTMVIPVVFVVIGSLLLNVLLSKAISGGIQLDGTYLGGPGKPLQFFSTDALEMATLQDQIEPTLRANSMQGVEPVALGPGDAWQSQILRSHPGVNASCGDPKQALTCASMILTDDELRHQTELTSEQKKSLVTTYQFATSDTALHGIPAALNQLNNVFLRDYVDGTILDRILVSLAPIEENAISGWHTLSVVTNFSSASILLAFCCCGASFGVNPAWERMHNCKIIQRISGISPSQYWFSQLVFDLLVYYVFCAAVFVVVYCLPSRTFFEESDAILGLFLAILGSGPAIIHLSYIFEGLFRSDFLCFGSLFALRAFVGIVFLEVGISLTVLESQGHAAAGRANDVLRWIVPISPEYCIARVFYDVVDSNFKGIHLSLGRSQARSLLPTTLYAFADSVLYSAVFWLFVQGKAIRWMTSLGLSRAPVQPTPSSLSEGKILRVSGLHFRFKSSQEKKGLFDLNFSLPRKGVLGLVGPCGSGKSTILQLLAGALKPSEGSILRIGENEESLFLQKQGFVTGYCPQAGGLFPRMTVQEHIQFYSQVWTSAGECEAHELDKENYLGMLGLKRYGAERVHTLSEGNKRKVNLAIALMAPSRLALLDEPSAGVDPEGQIRICNCIRKASRHKSIVMSSHSMEECEALCRRLAVLSDGRLSRPSTLKQLKGKYDRGLKLHLKLAARTEPAAEILSRAFPTASQVATSSDWHQCQIPEPASELERPKYLGGVFQAVQTLLASGLISDFRLSELGLEDAFVLD